MMRESPTPELEAHRLQEQAVRLRVALERMVRDVLDRDAADAVLGNPEYRRAVRDQIPAYHS
jgi:hypothetical protein